MSRDCCVALPRGAMGLSAVCVCGISLSYSLPIFDEINDQRRSRDRRPNCCLLSVMFVCLIVCN